jgi:serine/threonine protein kinase/Flp pilus assembly protein TadD
MTGRTISHYKILEKLGSGAMGTVYKARDLKLDRLVAMKFIAPSLPLEHRSRFVLEARAASALDHTNVCTIYEFGETDDGDLFIAMAYCPGENLCERIQRGPLPIAETLDIATQVALGLARAHRLGIVHRDIKPANIMLTPDGVVKVVDFGIAKLAHDIGLTRVGTPIGTVPYMSPEQIKAKALDYRTDIWSWGVVTYEMLAGQRPFRAESELLTAEAILTQEPLPLIQLRPELPFDLERIVLRALRKLPQERHQNSEELVRALRSVALPSGTLTAPSSSAPSAASIAVLPFVNMSTEPDSEYFSDGLTEELIHALSHVPNLHVVSRTSAFEFKGKPQSVRRIGEQLNVSSVVEGSVRKIGEKLRVSAQLVNVTDGYCLWSQRFDREIKDVFQIQDEIAQTIADTLPVKLGSDINRALTQRRTDNIEAYDLYLRGRFQWNKRSGEGLQRSLEYFELALAQDPSFAPAYSGVADYYIAVASWGLETPVSVWPKAKAAAERALQTDDTLAEAHASMGTIRMWYEWNWEEAEREFKRAIDLNPGDPYAHIQYNLLLLQNGRFVEAEREVRAALLSDPLSVRANSYLAGVFHYRREYDRSLKQCHRALELDPNDIELHVVLALNYQQKDDYDPAIQALEKARELSANFPLILGPLGAVYAESGDRAQALKFLDQLEQASQAAFVAPIARVMIYLGLQEHDLVFEWLEKAAETRDVLLCYLGIGPIYDRIRSDPRYTKLLHRIGLAQGAETQVLTA